MQPELTTASQIVPNLEATHDNSPPSSQHGIRVDDQPASLLTQHGQRSEPESAVSRRDRSPSSRSPKRVADVDETPRLSPTSPSPRNRIDEYENALFRSGKKKSEGPGFEVINKNRKPGDKSSPISKLPNGES
jgi:hypothetical protein